MAHPPPPTARSSDGDVLAPSVASPEVAASSGHDEGALLAELRGVAGALRSRLTWIKQGGVDGAPAPSPRRARAAVTAKSVAEGGSAGEDATPPPAAPTDDAAAIARAAVESASRMAARSQSAAPRAAVRRSAGDAPAAALASAGSATAAIVYPELQSLPQGAEGLRIIREFVGDCRRCKLCHSRNQLVFGEGNPSPWLAFVGEGPGADEDRSGLPFVGASGELLSKMIKGMGEHALKLGLPALAGQLSREQVYIGNIVKCRPPGNRVPEPDEIATCGGFITAQLTTLQPLVIVALGRTPTQFLLENNAPLGRLRGQFGDWRGVPVMPTYHPSYLLRTPSAKVQVWEDLKLVILRLAELTSDSARASSLLERNPS